MAKTPATDENGEAAKRTRVARPLKVVLIFDDFDGKKFNGLSAHRIGGNIADVVTEAAMMGRKVATVEIPPASDE